MEPKGICDHGKAAAAVLRTAVDEVGVRKEVIITLGNH